jgi:hypothetical protein
MIVTDRKTSIRDVIIDRIVPERIRKRTFEEYKDDSIELRRFLAAELAYTQFEQHKERALAESHRLGFIR